MKTQLLTTVIAGGLLLGSLSVEAKPRNEQQRDELNQATVALKELTVRDAGNVVTTELGNAEAWLKEAESYAKKRRTRDEFRQALDRVNASLALMSARLDASDAQAVAQSASDELAEAEGNLRQSQMELQALTEKRASLEKAVTR